MNSDFSNSNILSNSLNILLNIRNSKIAVFSGKIIIVD